MIIGNKIQFDMTLVTMVNAAALSSCSGNSHNTTKEHKILSEYDKRIIMFQSNVQYMFLQDQYLTNGNNVIKSLK